MSSNCRKKKQVGSFKIQTSPSEAVTGCDVHSSYTQVVMIEDIKNMNDRVHLRVEGTNNLSVRQNKTRGNLQPNKNPVDLPAIFDISLTTSPPDQGDLEIEVYITTQWVNSSQYISNNSPDGTIDVSVNIC